MIGAKCSRVLALPLREEKLGFLETLVLKILKERLWHSVSYTKQPQEINQ
jgi:hypothetical protein